MRTPSSPSTLTSSPRAQVRPPTTRSTVVPGGRATARSPLPAPAPRRRAGQSVPSRRQSRIGAAARNRLRAVVGSLSRVIGHCACLFYYGWARAGRGDAVARPGAPQPEIDQPARLGRQLARGARAGGRHMVADAQLDRTARPRPARRCRRTPQRRRSARPRARRNRKVVTASSTDATVRRCTATARSSARPRTRRRAPERQPLRRARGSEPAPEMAVGLRAQRDRDQRRISVGAPATVICARCRSSAIGGAQRASSAAR